VSLALALALGPKSLLTSLLIGSIYFLDFGRSFDLRLSWISVWCCAED